MSPTIDQVHVADLRLPERHARVHTKKQLARITASIKAYGFLSPVIINANNEVIVGAGRILAARGLAVNTVPAVRAHHLTEAQERAYRIADNRLCETGQWDPQVLAEDLKILVDAEFQVELTGFELSQVDDLIAQAAEADADAAGGPGNAIPEIQLSPVTRLGDVWELGRHRIVCGDSLMPETYVALLGDEKADMVFTDMPYGVPIDGFVGGGGATKHREFIMGAGEMTAEAFRDFVAQAHIRIAAVCKDGAILFSCMDWRHIGDLVSAGEISGLEFKNLIVWVKTNAGQGAFYRSQHELIAAFKVGIEPHTNNFGLGETGRHRSNCWRYAGVNTFRKGRMEELSLHPTVKPVELVADAIRDVSRPNEVVLDAFGGSGTTLIAAHACGRRARLIELDPLYVDVACRRWQAFTGRQAVRVADGLTFETAELAISEGEARDD